MPPWDKEAPLRGALVTAILSGTARAIDDMRAGFGLVSDFDFAGYQDAQRQALELEGAAHPDAAKVEALNRRAHGIRADRDVITAKLQRLLADRYPEAETGRVAALAAGFMSLPARVQKLERIAGMVLLGVRLKSAAITAGPHR